MLQPGAAEIPLATILTHGETVGQRQGVENMDIARGAQGGAPQCHTVERAIGTGQGHPAAGCHRAILDGAIVQRTQPARAKQPGAANVQRCAGVVQRAGKVHRATAAAEVRRQGTCLKCASQIHCAAGDVDLTRIGPTGRRDAQRAAADIDRAAVGECGGADIQRATRRGAQRAAVREGRGADREGLSCRVGIDGAGIDDRRRTALDDAAVALQRDTAVDLQGLAARAVARVEASTGAVDGGRARSGEVLQAGAEETPISAIHAHGQTIGQRQAVEYIDIARRAQAGAAQCHAVEYSVNTVQGHPAAGCHGAILDRAVELAQATGAEQGGVAYVQRCDRVVQRAGDVHAAAAAVKRKQVRRGECPSQVQRTGHLVERARVGPACRRDVERATVVPGTVACQRAARHVCGGTGLGGKDCRGGAVNRATAPVQCRPVRDNDFARTGQCATADGGGFVQGGRTCQAQAARRQAQVGVGNQCMGGLRSAGNVNGAGPGSDEEIFRRRRNDVVAPVQRVGPVRGVRTAIPCDDGIAVRRHRQRQAAGGIAWRLGEGAGVDCAEARAPESEGRVQDGERSGAAHAREIQAAQAQVRGTRNVEHVVVAGQRAVDIDVQGTASAHQQIAGNGNRARRICCGNARGDDAVVGERTVSHDHRPGPCQGAVVGKRGCSDAKVAVDGPAVGQRAGIDVEPTPGGGAHRATVGEGRGADIEGLAHRVGIDGAGVDDGIAAPVFPEAAIALQRDAAVDLHGLAVDRIDTDVPARTIDRGGTGGGEMVHGSGSLAGMVAIEVPVVPPHVDRDAGGQGEAIPDPQVAIDRQVAANGDAVEVLDVAGGQGGAIAADQRSVLDGAAEHSQAASAKHPGTANIHGCACVVQRAGKVDAAPAASEMRCTTQIGCGKGAIQIEDAAADIDLAGVAPGACVQVQRAAADVGRAAVGEGRGADIEGLARRVGIDRAGVDDGVAARDFRKAAIALQRDAAVDLYSLAVGRIDTDVPARTIDRGGTGGGEMVHGSGSLAGMVAIEVPVVPPHVDRDAGGQGEAIPDPQVAIDRQVAANGDAVEVLDVAGGQGGAIAADQRSVLDGAAEHSQAASAKHPGTANIHGCACVVQRAGKVDAAPAASEMRCTTQIGCGKGAIQIEDAAADIDLAGVAPGACVQVQRAAAYLERAAVGKAADVFNGEGLPRGAGIDGAGVDDGRRLVLGQVGGALQRDPAVNLQRLSANGVACIKIPSSTVQSGRSRTRQGNVLCDSAGAKAPLVAVFAHRQAGCQSQVVQNIEIAGGAQAGATQRHVVEPAVGTVQGATTTADHRAVPDGAAAHSQPARAKQAGAAYVQRCAGVVQCAGDVDAAPGASEMRSSAQIGCCEGAAQIQRAARDIDLTGVAPGACVQVQRAAADLEGATVGKAADVFNGEGLPRGAGIDGAGVDDGRRLVLGQVGGALQRDPAVNLQRLSANGVACIKIPSSTVQSGRSRTRQGNVLCDSAGAKAPLVAVFAHRQAGCQSQVVQNVEIARGIQACATQCHVVEPAVTAVQGAPTTADHRAVPDGATAHTQPACTKQPGAAYVQRCACVIQRPGKVHTAAGASEMPSAAQIGGCKRAAQIERAAVDVDLTGVAPGPSVEAQRTAADICRATVSESG